MSIATNGDVMNITSTAANNLIKWVDFSISGGKTVDFHDKNYLNYVTGSAVSDIQGKLTGTGSIYLVNPNGILIGDKATVNVGSLYLSTKELDPATLTSYDAGISALSSAAIGNGDVINLGTLNATSITVEGNNITFKNVADVKNGEGTAQNTNVKLTANDGGEIHLGFANETEADAVNDTEYKTVNEPALTDWTPSGTTVKYMLVHNKYELQNMKNNLAGKYMLAGDIDMDGFGNFTPIGTSNNAFTGKFDGLNYKIMNLKIEKPGNDNVGLFCSNTGTIENVGMVGGSITGKSYVGGIVGSNSGTVENTYNTGVVSGTYRYVGGIAGSNRGTVENTYNTGAVSGTNQYVGGITGINTYGTIKNAYNTGAVSGTKYVGGIVGINIYGTVENAYNTGAVSGTKYVGGIVGINIYGTVENAYNTGAASGTDTNVGGIAEINFNEDSKVTNAYCLDARDPIGENRGGQQENVKKVSESDLKKAAAFEGFNFANGVSENGAWRIYEDKTMPLLTAFLKRKDNITSVTESDGTTAVGATYTATTYNGVQEQIGGYNYIKDVSIVTPAPTPEPTPTPTPTNPADEPTQELPRALETIVGNEQRAKEYTDTIAALESTARDENQAAPPQEKLAAGTTATHAAPFTIENGGTAPRPTWT